MRKRINSACQKVVSFDTLCTFRGDDGTATVGFRVPIPDSRLRVKISLLYVTPTGDVVVEAELFESGTLWLREVELDESGVQGSYIPCADIEGTQAAPLDIPAFLGLLGYSREFISSADAIEGVATFDASESFVGGSWVLQTRYQPNGVRFTNEEWNEIEAGCNPSVTSGPVTII